MIRKHLKHKCLLLDIVIMCAFFINLQHIQILVNFEVKNTSFLEVKYLEKSKTRTTAYSKAKKKWYKILRPHFAKTDEAGRLVSPPHPPKKTNK